MARCAFPIIHPPLPVPAEGLEHLEDKYAGAALVWRGELVVSRWVSMWGYDLHTCVKPSRAQPRKRHNLARYPMLTRQDRTQPRIPHTTSKMSPERAAALFRRECTSLNLNYCYPRAAASYPLASHATTPARMTLARVPRFSNSLAVLRHRVCVQCLRYTHNSKELTARAHVWVARKQPWH